LIRLEQLPQVAEETLGGLHADPGLLHRVPKRPAARITPQGRALAFALSLALVLGLGALTFSQMPQAIPQVSHQQAGSAEGLPEGSRSLADVPRDSLVLSQEDRPDYQGVWARSSGGNFPLIRLDGRYYRLLNSPTDARGLIGQALGTVALTTDEPALDRSGDVLSSVVGTGEDVYAVNGLGGGAVAAMVEGRMRVFQRVSFAGSALIGSESLRDTLPAGASTLQLSGVGSVTDPALVARLMDTLLSQAAFQGSQLNETGQALLIHYPNGLVLQMAVSGTSLGACGTWSCPPFFEAFQAAVQ